MDIEDGSEGRVQEAERGREEGRRGRAEGVRKAMT